MTRNELKLEIWNRINLCRLSEKNVEALKAELSDNEIGAFVDLFSDCCCGLAFLRTEAIEKELEWLFEYPQQIKEMAAQYAKLQENKIAEHMRYVACFDEIEDIIKMLQEMVEDKTEQCPETERPVLEKILNYACFLRFKFDSSGTDLSLVEQEMLQTVAACDENWINFLVARFLCFFSNEIVDIAAAENFFQAKKAFIEQYARELSENEKEFQ